MAIERKAIGDFRRVQLLQLEMLSEIDRLCKENNLVYYIIAGTLLGAVRHGGFIPWDMDIDIAMFRENYEKLIKEGNKQIDERFFIQSDYSDKNHRASFAKVRANKTLFIEKGNKIMDSHHGFYIDIFPLDDIKETPSRIEYYNAKFLKLLQRVKAFRNGKIYSTKTSRTIISGIISGLTMVFPKKSINDFIQKRMTKDNNKGFKFVTNYCSKYGILKQFMAKGVYGDSIEIEFEGRKFRAPSKYLYWLERIYGDYMKMPNTRRVTDSISDKYIYDLGPFKDIKI